MTGLEEVLLGIIVLLAGGIGSKIIFPGVNRQQCADNHDKLEQLIEAKLEPLGERLDRIESKIDQRNGIK